MLDLTTVVDTVELEQILTLQQQNLVQNIDEIEMQTQGFVTMIHNIDVLQRMHDLAPSVIAKDNGRVVGYALVMLRECRELFPPLEPMFKNFDNLEYRDRPLNDYRFYVMGQVCIDKQYRRTGLFDQLYKKHKEIYENRFDFIMTEVSTRNQRSLRAHERVGFEILNTYSDELDEWAVILWNWK
ncbi:MAG: GNAT family N-acetyltransferase [Chitinophagaceae bacterium]|nr:GNAT family N-acetyltransferase [Chitinophagaceae bacterium]